MNSKTIDKIATIVISIISLSIVVILGLLIIYILKEGISVLNFNFIFGMPKLTKEGGGIGPILFNSLYMLLISLVITIPIGVGSGIYLAEYAKNGTVLKIVRLSLETISSLPSIVIGMFGLLIFVTYLNFGYSIIAGALSVSILNIPSLARISESAIRSSAKKVKEASIGLGATKWQTIIKVTLPIALSEIITGIILASGRIFGEAAAFLYTAGLSSSSKLNFNNISLTGSSAFSLFRPAETLAVHIWKLNSEGIVPDAEKIANGTSVVLLIAVLIFNICAKLASKRLMKLFNGK